ncbi:MAG: hypothetical protein HOQ18_01800 [Dermatophilaceae bacterium]|nr:hypothetical protein [Dermatophilaceae bacterium]NUR80098.1 hypothetical protein [Dermatophilaceae bacterium]
MISALGKGRVDALRIVVACARSLDDVPHDVYLLELVPTTEAVAGSRFDELPYLECLEPVLGSSGGMLPWVVEVSRTHRGDRDGMGRAQLSVLLAVGDPPADGAPAPDLGPLMAEAFSRMVGRFAPDAPAPDRAEALGAAMAAVAHAYPDVDARALSLTDEEHHAEEGCWTVGLAVVGVTRFRVQLGLAPGLSASTHVHRVPLGEVVDSVGV